MSVESVYPNYREEASFLCDVATIAKSPETRLELLQLAAAYERLASTATAPIVLPTLKAG